MAFVLLNEDVKPFQWFGIVLIIIAIIIMNVNFKRKQLEV
jgi:drug/metabolite transporter (DMT)-like permease